MSWLPQRRNGEPIFDARPPHIRDLDLGNTISSINEFTLEAQEPTMPALPALTIRIDPVRDLAMLLMSGLTYGEMMKFCALVEGETKSGGAKTNALAKKLHAAAASYLETS